MMGKILARAIAILLALTLAACGGDENSSPLAGSPNSNGGEANSGDQTTEEATQVGTIELVASPVRLDASANVQSSITARVKDSSGILLEGISVGFSASNGGTLEVTQQTTDQAGVASAILTTDGDFRNRTVTISAQSGSVSDTVDIEISGTSLSVSGPSSISLNGTTPIRVALSDAEGNGIPNEPISLSTTLGSLSASSVTTDPNGFIDVQLNAGSTSGTATVSASAFGGSNVLSATRSIVISDDSFGFTSPTANTEVDLGATQELVLRWLENGNPVNGQLIKFTATRGTLTPANGEVTTVNGEARIDISSSNAGLTTVTASDPSSGLSTDLTFEFVATTPNEINLQAANTQLDLNETTEIIAIIRDINNNLVKNQEVTFNLLQDDSGGSLTSSRDVTDSQGRASTVYNAGSTSSGRDGVEIRATVGGTITDTVNLTVARQALRLAVGTGNELEEPDSVRYRKPYVAIVTDANGAPVENANIELSVLPIAYRKGSYSISANDTWVIAAGDSTTCDAEDVNQNGVLDTEDTNGNDVLDPGEDSNGNGLLDTEDTNGSDRLEPTNSATTSAASITSAADGSADFALLYPQSHCNWVAVRLTATVRVGGSESVETSEFALSCLASDLDDTAVSPPGGTGGLYGSDLNCANTD